MNITGGQNISLFEVQEAAEIVASASHEELNMIFGSVINENLKDEMIVTIIATGFTEQEREKESPVIQNSPVPSEENVFNPYRRERRKQPTLINHGEPVQDYHRHSEKPADSLDIPTFLRNRKRR